MIEDHSQLLTQIQTIHERSRPPRALDQCEVGADYCVVGSDKSLRVKRAQTRIRFLTPRACARAAFRAGTSNALRTIQSLGGIVVLISVAVLWYFGTLWPCGVLREAARQRDSLAAVLPDSIVDLALAGQYGPLSSDRCIAVLMNNLGTPILSTAQSRSQTMQPFPRPAPVPPVKVRETERRHDVGTR